MERGETVGSSTRRENGGGHQRRRIAMKGDGAPSNADHGRGGLGCPWPLGGGHRSCQKTALAGARQVEKGGQARAARRGIEARSDSLPYGGEKKRRCGSGGRGKRRGSTLRLGREKK